MNDRVQFSPVAWPLVVAAVLALSSCEQKPLEPAPKTFRGEWTLTRAIPAIPLDCIWAASPTDVFAGGPSGHIIHYDGSSWSEMTTGVRGSISDLWGRSGTEVYATVRSVLSDECGLMRYDGSRWSFVRPGVWLEGVWGDETGHVFAVGREVILHFDGSAWSDTTVSAGFLRGVWGSSASDVFVVGESGTILRFDGSTWVPMETPANADFLGIWGQSSDNVYAYGYGKGADSPENVVIHFDGREWQVVPVPNPSAHVVDLWGNDRGEFFFVTRSVLRFDGETWTSLEAEVCEPDFEFACISGTADGHLFVGSWLGRVLHYDGSSWRLTRTGLVHLTGVWASDSDNIIATAQAGVVFRWNGEAWREETVSPSCRDLFAVWGIAEDDVLVVGDAGTIARYDGTGWTLMESGVSAMLWDVWASGPHDAWVVGDEGVILRYDGSSWARLDPGFALEPWAVWGTSSSDVFIGGSAGEIIHWDGRSWRAMASGTRMGLWEIWGVAPDAVFAVGGGRILFFDGSQWRSMGGGGGKLLRTICGTSFDNVFAAGEEGSILHFDGALWEPVLARETVLFTGIWAISPSEVVAVGTEGRVYRCRRE